MSFRLTATASILAILAGCTQAIDNPAQSPAYVAAALGYDAYKQGDLATAEIQFETALSSEPDNPYALLGLGAVRENTGDLQGARQLYTAAKGTGTEAQANYTYITEQRLERVANIDVASLAEENLARLSVRQAAAAAPKPADFVSYDDGIATATPEVADIAPEVYTAPEPEIVGDISGENYQSVGSYETYIASISNVAEPVYAEPTYADLTYTELATTIETTVYTEPSYVAAEPVPDIQPASYTDVPYYDASLSYDELTMPVQTETLANLNPTYAPVSQTVVATPVGPAGRVLQYGQAFGDPVDLISTPRPEPVAAKDVNTITQAGDLIFLSDG